MTDDLDISMNPIEPNSTISAHSAETKSPQLERWGWVALAVVVLVLVPLFMRMPVWVDVDFYDVCARHVLRGGSLERDFLFLPPPGMVWALIAVRSVLGWSSESVRLADLAVLSANVWLLVRMLAATGRSRATQVWAVVIMFAFYLTTSEFVHCQPDSWMLL